ncbi:MAG: PAS domain S-box protein, partial [Fimbriimonadaceae bacterium]|nr:PAS domain S-box protein [Alphaproteobacteria bacterium]
MWWLLKHCPITKRRYLLIYAGIAAVTISTVSVILTYLSFREFDPVVLNRAILVSFIAPIIIAYPSLCLSISRYAKLMAISEQLKLKKKELSDLINVLPDIISTADASRRLTWVNHKYCEIVGQNPDFLIGKDFLELVHPQSRDTVETVIGNLSPQNPTSSHKELHAHPDGSERWIYWTNMKRFDPGDQPTEILSVGKDITELHDAQLEIEAQAAELEQSNRALEKVNRELNQFTSFASHDLQEPLRKIRFFSEVLTEAVTEKDEKTVAYALDVLSTSANRSRALVANLLALSQTSNEPLSTAWIDLTKLLDSVISDLS